MTTRKRINELARLIPLDSVVADIGCDHAYLLMELVNNNKIKYGYGVDNKVGPIKNALTTVEKYHLASKVNIIKADGLDFKLDPKINTLVFAGLGGLKVINIIKKDLTKLKNIKYIITDIHRDDLKLKEYLSLLHYKIKESVDIIDMKKKYHLVRYENF